MLKGGMGNLMKQAQKMQADMQKAQEELAAKAEHVPIVTISTTRHGSKTSRGRSDHNRAP